MHGKDTVIIFQKPGLYFFPRYADMVFAPFCIPEKSLRYLLYKVLCLLGLPCRSLFWGEWKRHIPGAKQAIIFDYGYQPGMEAYIRRVNPDCRVVLFYWNRVGRYNSSPLQAMEHRDIYSTDPGDCERYQLKYNHIFYPRELFRPSLPLGTNRLFFIGTDKGRAPYIKALKPVLEQSGLTCDIRILPQTKDREYRRQYQEILTDAPLPYEEYLLQLDSCDVLLDLCQKGQTALTMRVMEAIYLSKKLITGNQSIVRYDFYDPDKIFLLPENDSLPNPEDLQNFLRKPFVPYSDAILEAYSFEHWKSNFL